MAGGAGVAGLPGGAGVAGGQLAGCASVDRIMSQRTPFSTFVTIGSRLEQLL